MTQPTILISQRSPSDCAFCCVAMALGISYEALEAKAGAAFMHLMNNGAGCDAAMERALFSAIGLVRDADFTERHFGLSWCNYAHARGILWGRRAIITVRSLNIEDGFHAVFWNGAELFDPSPKKRYAQLTEFDPLSAILFRETPVTITPPTPAAT